MHSIFGYTSEFVAYRIYSVVAKGYKERRIFFPEWIQAIFGLLYGSEYQKNQFIFQFYDIDRDGCLEGNDLMEIMENISKTSVIGEEIEILNQHYLQSRIRAVLKHDKEKITMRNFRNHVVRSCLIEEFRNRLTAKPGTEHTFSAFSEFDSNMILLRKAYQKYSLESKKKKNLVKKEVRFTGICTLEEEEAAKALKETKVMPKDAAKGVEDENLAFEIEDQLI